MCGRSRRKDVSIFLKIFLSSWIATIVIASILVGLIGIPDRRMTPVSLAPAEMAGLRG